jgi:hypothetical protein
VEGCALAGVIDGGGPPRRTLPAAIWASLSRADRPVQA